MIPRSLRLSRAGFARAGSLMRTHSAHFSVSYGHSPTLAGGGIVVPKKIAKKSVDRHLLKRRMREVVRPYLSADQSLIVYAKPGAPSLSFPELNKELSALIEGILPKS